MALTTRALSWSILGVDGTPLPGTLTITPSAAQIVDITNGVVYMQNTLTYPISVGVSVPIVTTDNTGTNPSAGDWGYDIKVQTTPGVPDLLVGNVQVPHGSGSFNLAAVLNADGL